MSGALAIFTKRPGEVLDYRIDFVDWLAEGETITEVVASTDMNGISISDVAAAGTEAVFWLRNGLGGERYHIAVRIETSMGRINSECVVVNVLSYSDLPQSEIPPFDYTNAWADTINTACYLGF